MLVTVAEALPVAAVKQPVVQSFEVQALTSLAVVERFDSASVPLVQVKVTLVLWE